MKKIILIPLLASALLVGCGDPAIQAQQAAAPVVVVETVSQIPYQNNKTFVGRIEAIEDTSITAQVTGYLQQRHFIEGQMVEMGDLLYTIEPSSFEAQVATAKAALTHANAELKKASLDINRGKKLLPKGGISQSEFDNLTAKLLGAEAQVEAAQSQLNLAEVNLSYTEIKAPFSGRISQSKVSQGDLVSPSAGVLATLVSLEPVHAIFSVSERERLNLSLDKLKASEEQTAELVEVQVILENNQRYEHLGSIDYAGNRINLDTGTLDLRAVVPNPDYRLLPGQNIRVELREKNKQNVTVVPRRAVQTDLGGNFVMVMTEGEVAERRDVELGMQTEQGVIISNGLEPGETIITQGLQRVRNGMNVQIQGSETETK
ncbi:efflux RND transporter periplasmic adaptor subunit [Vibrio sinaloensis]|uniref:efflux RND transporter periplasmic adaptor subunit n=1 Tax=Photobacterium sp. (strain ATCC 43367) TaxID=379097 RepID=UPI0024A7A269|nr:efflux RND transporter periplasmic adaptor subunit [Vibrio sinaloensis]